MNNKRNVQIYIYIYIFFLSTGLHKQVQAAIKNINVKMGIFSCGLIFVVTVGYYRILKSKAQAHVNTISD